MYFEIGDLSEKEMKQFVIMVDAGYGQEFEIVEAESAEEAESIAADIWNERIQDIGDWGVMEEVTEDTDIEEY